MTKATTRTRKTMTDHDQAARIAAMRARLAQAGGPPPLGLHVLMGATAPQKSANMMSMIERGVIAPVEMLARK